MRFLLDTSGYSAFKRGQSDAVDAVGAAELILFSPVVLGELYGGFEIGSRRDINRSELERFLQSPRVRIVGIDDRTADAYALIYKQLRSDGKPIPTNDMWIAATAIQHAVAVFTMDTHFQSVMGLRSGARLADIV